MYVGWRFQKASAKPLYVSRPVVNADEIIAWYRDQGCTLMVAPEDMHVTVLYSKKPVDWDTMGDSSDRLSVNGDARSVGPLGDEGAVVMHIESDALSARHDELVSKGGSHDYDSYNPHITLSYKGEGYETANPFPGRIVLGPEKFEEIEKNQSPVLKEGDMTTEDLEQDGGKLQPENGPPYKKKKRRALDTETLG